ncbi:myotilin isoform X2 [Spea bombifrons]|uniref:myotilin isoform X2 n=1 Tax=Spea bombifrons TaxID=233779 RepID=UPI00234BA7F0|nr:myotilin isoform X2 [Spea bombifrons]
MSLTSLPSITSKHQPTVFNYERPKHFIQSQPKRQAESDSQVAATAKDTSKFANATILIHSQNQSRDKEEPPPLCSSIASVPALSFSVSTPMRPEVPGLLEPTNISLHEKTFSGRHSEDPHPFQCIAPLFGKSMDKTTIINKKADVPKFTINCAPKAVQQMSDKDIQGTKDALIQDLERKLKCKDDILHNGNQRLTYEERMARRLLGPQNAASVFEEHGFETQGSKHMSESTKNLDHPTKTRNRSSSEKVAERGSIQEKCFPPRFLQVPENLVVDEGRFCRINFKVTGLPNPDVTWYLNGKLVQADDLHKMIVSEKGVHSFIFEVVRACDAGSYECIATNCAGQASFILQLDVIAQECRTPPFFIKKPAATRAYEGDNIQMECQVCARPQPTILLKKNNEMLQYNTDRIRLLQESNGQIYLFIYNVKKSDDGWYTISAVNEAGVATCHARLDVSSKNHIKVTM